MHQVLTRVRAIGRWWTALAAAAVALLWAQTLKTGVTPNGDGNRIFPFIDFVRRYAHGIVLWNPLRNGGYPMFGDAEHHWMLAVLINPAAPWASFELNLFIVLIILTSLVPVWLIGRSLGWEPFWIAIAMISFGFTERLLWSQESGRYQFLLVHAAVLFMLWIVLVERPKPWQYALLAVCVAITVQEVVYNALPYGLMIYAGLLLAPHRVRTDRMRRLVTASAMAAAVGLMGLLLSAIWTLPLVGDFSRSEVGISQLTYAPNLPSGLLDYARLVIPFAPADPELISFISLLVIPAILFAGWKARFSDAERRLLLIGTPIFFWAALFMSMSLPIIGPGIETIYRLSPLVAGARWFALLEDAAANFLVLGGIALFRGCGDRQVSELDSSRRLLLGAFFALCAASAFIHGRGANDPAVVLIGSAFAALTIYAFMSAGRWRLRSCETLRASHVAASLAICSVAAIALSMREWERLPIYTNNAPTLPKLERAVRNDDSGYFRYLREDQSTLWWLDSYKRGVLAYSLYYPKGLAYSLTYLSAHHDVEQLRPLWVRLVGCPDFDDRALRLLGVKYMFCRDRVSGPLSLPDWDRIGSENGQSLFRRRDYEDGITLFGRWESAPPEPPAEARGEVLAAFSRHVALVTGGPAEAVVAPVSPTDKDSVVLTMDRPGHLRLNVTSRRHALLFIPDNFDSGWRATVNDTSRPVLRVFQAYLGVMVPAGHSTVDLVFGDRYVVFGSLLSGAAVLVLIGYLALTSSALWKKHTPERIS